MPPEPSARSKARAALLAFLTLVTFSVSQSVYNMLAANQVFLTLRQVSNLELLGVIAVFNLLPAAALCAVWLLLRTLSPALARIFFAAAVAALFLLFFLQVHKLYFPAWSVFAGAELLWMALAALVGWASVRFEKPFRLFIRVLSPVIILFPALFLLRTWADRGQLPPPPAPAPPPRAAAAPLAAQPPILFLLLDELSLDALVGPGGQIDPQRFPNFHRLAAESHFFLNASANADQTTLSLPAILTGGLPTRGAPTARNYPQNLLALLELHYDIYAYESVTGFCEPDRFHCLAATRQGAVGHAEFLRDVFFLSAARVVQPQLGLGLPDLRQTWGPFRDAPALVTARVERFEKFMDALPQLSASKPFFFFFHHMLPHAPYLLSPDGRLEDDPLNAFTPELKGDAAGILKVKQRYEWQIRFTDNQVGRFVARLKDLGLYDRSLVIVTADHGVSYDPETPGRALVAERNAEMILLVPLFIKLPQQARGEVSERDVQLVDLVPTIAAQLGLEVPWPLAGRSVFAPDPPARQKIAYDQFGRRFELPPDLSRCVIHTCDIR
ncbi:MAG: sulfatase-like hydrolase/transferase [Candidatus Acidiferrales bacterium]